MVIRLSLDETPVFTEEKQAGRAAKVPLAILMRHYKGAVIRVVLAALVSSVSTIFGVWSLSFAVNEVHLDRSLILLVAVCTNTVALFLIPVWGRLADRIGRKPVYIFGVFGSGVLMFAYLWALTTGSYILIFAIGILMSGIVYQAVNAVFPAFFSEMFPTRVRLSGMALGTQIGFGLCGFAPTIAAAIAGTGTSGWLPVALMVFTACVIAAIASFTARETSTLTLAQIDADGDARMGLDAPVSEVEGVRQ